MGRAIAAIVAGYMTMFAFVFVTFSLAYLGMGAERAFTPGSYAVSGTWILVSFVLSFLAALTGGVVCRRLGRTRKPVLALAALVVVLGAIMAVPAFNAPRDVTTMQRTGDVPNMEAMQKALPPAWVSALTPLVGALGVLLAARRT